MLLGSLVLDLFFYQVRVRIGSPITGYGQESRNRAARQRIPHRVWTDEEGVEHVEVNILVFTQIYLLMYLHFVLWELF